jgi:tetratricopeptide (TPR) repeat protein
VKTCFNLLLLILLVRPYAGLGQQPSAPGFDSLVAAAEKAQAANDYATAAADLSRAVKLHPEIPELWANLGLMQHEISDTSGAIMSFQKALHINPSLYVPNLFLGIDYQHSGKSEEAIPYLTKAEKINPTDPQAPLALGRAYVRVDKFNAAAKELNRAITLDSKLGAAWFTLGIARLDQVESDAYLMSSVDKASPFAGALYAESLEKQARFGEAVTLLKTLLNSDPQPPCIRSELGFALIREHDADGAASAFADERTRHPGCGLALLGQARLAIEKGDTEQALKTLGELWKRDHGFFAANVAVLLEGMPESQSSAFLNNVAAVDNSTLPADARDALLAAFNQPGFTTPQAAVDDASAKSTETSPVRTAEDYYAAGQFEACKNKIDAGQKPIGSGAKPIDAAHLRLLAACAFSTGDNRTASEAATELRTLDPHSIEGLYWSIQANERLAFQSLAHFQQLEPDSARSHVLLGNIYHQLERYDDAQIEYQKALALAPSDPAAALGLATSYLDNYNSKGAIALAQDALARNPDDPEWNLLMGEALIDQRQFADAELHLKKSLNVKPQMLPGIHALMGKAYAETGDTKLAIEELKLGESSDTDGSLEYLLARLYRQTGDTKDAIEALNRMKLIKQQREARGVKRVEDPDLSPVEAVASQVSTP